ncbi:MAG: Bug family tripartite tricarboxylate transporter substrate binding protein [Burkholderiales bacterium]
MPATAIITLVRAIASFSCVLAITAPAAAQQYPQKPVRVIVSYAPGGAGDVMARVFGQKLAESWGQQMIVDNRPGANGMIGAAAVARAAPDGYTFLFGYVSEVAINPSLYAKMAYDPAKELVPVAMGGVLPLLLVSNPSLPAKSVRDLLRLAKARPGELTYGSAGYGSPAHLGAEYLKRTAGVDITHVPYKGGAEVVTAILSGQVMVFFSGIPPAIAHVRSGRLRALAVSTAGRVPGLEEVPPVAESGVKGFDMAGWFGYFAPAGTPREVVDKLASGVSAILRQPETGRLFVQQGIVIAEMGPEKFAPFIQAEAQKYARIIRESGAKAE